MLKTTSPFIVMTETELKEIIQHAAREGAKEAIRQLGPTLSRSRPASVTQADAARILGMSRPTISKMLKAGVFRLDRLGKIPMDQIDSATLAQK